MKELSTNEVVSKTTSANATPAFAPHHQHAVLRQPIPPITAVETTHAITTTTAKAPVVTENANETLTTAAAIAPGEAQKLLESYLRHLGSRKKKAKLSSGNNALQHALEAAAETRTADVNHLPAEATASALDHLEGRRIVKDRLDETEAVVRQASIDTCLVVVALLLALGEIGTGIRVGTVVVIGTGIATSAGNQIAMCPGVPGNEAAVVESVAGETGTDILVMVAHRCRHHALWDTDATVYYYCNEYRKP